MATNNTPNLQLVKPTPGTGENVSVQAHLNDNWDKIDTAYGNQQAATTTILKVHKTANQSVTNSTVLVADNHLFVPVAANSIYDVHAYLPYNGPAPPNGGFKPSWVLPAGATLKWTSFGTNGHSGGTLVEYDVVVQAAAGGRIHGTNAGTSMSLAPRGTLVTTGTAGTCALWWAQGTAHATPTILEQYASLMLIKIA